MFFVASLISGVVLSILSSFVCNHLSEEEVAIALL